VRDAIAAARRRVFVRACGWLRSTHAARAARVRCAVLIRRAWSIGIAGRPDRPPRDAVCRVVVEYPRAAAGGVPPAAAVLVQAGDPRHRVAARDQVDVTARLAVAAGRPALARVRARALFPAAKPVARAEAAPGEDGRAVLARLGARPRRCRSALAVTCGRHCEHCRIAAAACGERDDQKGEETAQGAPLMSAGGTFLHAVHPGPARGGDFRPRPW